MRRVLLPACIYDKVAVGDLGFTEVVEFRSKSRLAVLYKRLTTVVVVVVVVGGGGGGGWCHGMCRGVRTERESGVCISGPAALPAYIQNV